MDINASGKTPEGMQKKNPPPPILCKIIIMVIIITVYVLEYSLLSDKPQQPPLILTHCFATRKEVFFIIFENGVCWTIAMWARIVGSHKKSAFITCPPIWQWATPKNTQLRKTHAGTMFTTKITVFYWKSIYYSCQLSLDKNYFRANLHFLSFNHLVCTVHCTTLDTCWYGNTVFWSPLYKDKGRQIIIITIMSNMATW